MPISAIRSPLAVGVVAILAAGAFLAGSSVLAQSDQGAGIVVGTYQPQQVAQAVGVEQEVAQEMQALQQRAQQAQQEGDQAALQQIQAEAQQIQQQAEADFRADIEGVMTPVAEATGATVIAIEVAYAAPGITTTDVTQEIIEALDAEAPQREQDE